MDRLIPDLAGLVLPFRACFGEAFQMFEILIASGITRAACGE